MIGSGATLGVAPPKEATLFIIATLVSDDTSRPKALTESNFAGFSTHKFKSYLPPCSCWCLK